MKNIRVLATGLKFPEGPVYAGDGSIYLTEIQSGRIIRVQPDGIKSVIADCGNGVNGLAVGPDGAFYACNNGGLVWRVKGETIRAVVGVPPEYTTGSIQRIDPITGEVKTLYTHCGEFPLYGPNDLVFDKDGGFYFTDFGKTRNRDRDIGSVHYATIDGSTIREIIHPIANPNGVALSPDQKTLYVDETETSRLWAYDILGPGVVSIQEFPSPNGGRLIHGLPGYQRFDGIAVEKCGNICVATLIKGQISVFSPDGELLEEVKMPDIYPTNICFGGKDMKKAYITLSFTGQLIEIDWLRPGLRLNC